MTNTTAPMIRYAESSVAPTRSIFSGLALARRHIAKTIIASRHAVRSTRAARQARSPSAAAAAVVTIPDTMGNQMPCGTSTFPNMCVPKAWRSCMTSPTQSPRLTEDTAASSCGRRRPQEIAAMPRTSAMAWSTSGSPRKCSTSARVSQTVWFPPSAVPLARRPLTLASGLLNPTPPKLLAFFARRRNAAMQLPLACLGSSA
mmetsp:Transcript_65554/g.185940  ORF Transcript_65554/g.185940 Transcript_65554/m.185940 type:complete len:202 (-) Transcript_65554:8-613(-)